MEDNEDTNKDNGGNSVLQMIRSNQIDSDLIRV
jgi:hypothetical protein